MPVSYRLVVFNALMMRALIINDDEQYHDELAAFRIAFQGRRFNLVITEGIISEYQADSRQAFPTRLQPVLNNHLRQGRAVFLDENLLNRAAVELSGLPREHSAFILDAVAAGADYLVTKRRSWLNLSEQTESRYGFRIVTPARFVELEG